VDHCVLKFNCHLYIEQAKTKDKYNWNNGDYPKLIEYLNIKMRSDHILIQQCETFSCEVFKISFNQTKQKKKTCLFKDRGYE